MPQDYGMYQGYNVEPAMQKDGMNVNTLPGVVCPVVYECPQERCIHREIVHEVPHVCPINTKIINHHIYKHTYSPCYSCTEENEVCNVQEGCCSKF